MTQLLKSSHRYPVPWNRSARRWWVTRLTQVSARLTNPSIYYRPPSKDPPKSGRSYVKVCGIVLSILFDRTSASNAKHRLNVTPAIFSSNNGRSNLLIHVCHHGHWPRSFMSFEHASFVSAHSCRIPTCFGKQGWKPHATPRRRSSRIKAG